MRPVLLQEQYLGKDEAATTSIVLNYLDNEADAITGMQ